MSQYFINPEQFDKFLEYLEVEPYKLKDHPNLNLLLAKNVILRKYPKADHPEQEFIQNIDILYPIVKKLQYLDKKIQEMSDRIDQTWDVLSERVADIEKKYQISEGYLTSENKKNNNKKRDKTR